MMVLCPPKIWCSSVSSPKDHCVIGGTGRTGILTFTALQNIFEVGSKSELENLTRYNSAAKVWRIMAPTTAYIML